MKAWGRRAQGEPEAAVAEEREENGARRPAVVLLSGGLDSATVAAAATAQGFAVHALSFDYGQRHKFELGAAARVAAALGVAEHRTVSVDLAGFGGSALVAGGDAGDVPKDRDLAAADPDREPIPPTYVPARNTVFLSLALAWAETIGAFDIFIGVNALDYSGYPDCRPAFIRAFETTANLATAAGVEGRGAFHIHAPLLRLTKAGIIRYGLALGVDYGLTHSCYDPEPRTGAPCGRCDACQLRAAGFAEAGVPDPLLAGG
jgi:7-cyano-7-deazaguanine synthase